MLENVERFIAEINRIDGEFFKDYFETGKVEMVNLKHTFAKVPTQPILTYRLNLHEASNDYLISYEKTTFFKGIAYPSCYGE